jgi:hypothetical protein
VNAIRARFAEESFAGPTALQDLLAGRREAGGPEPPLDERLQHPLDVPLAVSVVGARPDAENHSRLVTRNRT